MELFSNDRVGRAGFYRSIDSRGVREVDESTIFPEAMK